MFGLTKEHKRTPCRWFLLGWVSLLILTSAVHAQRRGENLPSVVPLTLTLSSAYRFGEVVLLPGVYHVFVATEGLALIDPETKMTVGTLSVEKATRPDMVSSAKIEQQAQGELLRLVVYYQDEMLIAMGQQAKPEETIKRGVEYAAKSEASIAGGLPHTASDEALVDTAFARYLSGISHCVDGVVQRRWKTDDARFIKCVCPILEKWRMPKVNAPVRLVRFIDKKERVGVSFTVTPKGQAQQCRVWVGQDPDAASSTTATSGSVPAKTE